MPALLVWPCPRRQIHFVPGTRHSIVIQKNGVVRYYKSLAPSVRSGVQFLDIRASVNNRANNGLYACRMDPAWPATPFMYCVYQSDVVKDPRFGNDFPNPDAAMYSARPTQVSTWRLRLAVFCLF
jgi:hypothetical protein